MGKKTPLDELSDLTVSQSYYFGVIARLREFSCPITLQDINSYCSMFSINDKLRLLKIASEINRTEREID
jgi:hypothetical protein